jgi:hypothetical protein
LDLITKKPPGLTNARGVNSDELFRLTGLSTNDASPPFAIVWSAVGNLIPKTAVRELKSRLDEIGVQGIVLPLIDPIPVDICPPDGSIHSLNLIVLEELEESRQTSNVAAGEIRQAFKSSWRDSLFRSVSSVTATREAPEISIASLLKADRVEPYIEGDSAVLSEEAIEMPISFNSMPMVPNSAVDSFMANLSAGRATRPESTEFPAFAAKPLRAIPVATENVAQSDESGAEDDQSELPEDLISADPNRVPLRPFVQPALPARMPSLDVGIPLEESITGKIGESETVAAAMAVGIEISDSF